MKISILIGSRNRAHILEPCLASILAQSYIDFEVIVLDDASENPTAYQATLAKFRDPRIHLMRSERPLGVSGSRNLLMQEATGDIFFVIDDDAYIEHKSSLSRIVDIFEVKQDVGIVACKVQNHGVVERPYNVPFSQKILRRDPTVIEKGQYVGYFVGTAHAIRREVIDMCGSYNASLFFGEEELDLSYRAISKGWRIWYEPSILVHHVPQPSVVGKGRGDDELLHHVKNRFYLAWRYLPARYIAFYLAVWLGKYFCDAAKKGFLGAYFRGLVLGIRVLRNTPREPLRKEAVRYLKMNFGRLWY